MGVRRGLTPARGIIHLHSPYSHDACDGEPRAFDGSLDESCLADLKRALCTDRIDFAALTDHDATMADEAFADLFLSRGDVDLLPDPAAPTAGRLRCDDGHRVLLFVGGENDQMPILLDRHPDGTVDQRHAAYNSEDPADMARWRDLGGLAWYAHTEKHPLDKLRAARPDGIEIYNLHANIDPDIRQDLLGLDGPGAIRAVVQFADTSPEGPEPDLALLSFLEPNDVSLGRWDALLADGMRVWGSAGTDAHQNALPLELRDGERGDSYRRMIRWFSNVVLADDPTDPASIEAALRAGRMFVAFELFGTPVGFDVTAGGAELGGDVAPGDALVVSVPEVLDLDPSLPAPDVHAVILRIDPNGSVTEVARGRGPEVTATVEAGAAAYRVEVRIVPRHLGPYLGNLGPDDAEREHVWIYANPVFVRPPSP